MTKAQLDMFAGEETAAAPQPVRVAPCPDRIRVKLATVLKQLERAETMPWDRRTKAFHETVVPQMAGVLPDEEAQAILATFRRELERLG